MSKSWKCQTYGCPDRLPVKAEQPPQCYTCGKPMPEWQWEIQFAPLVSVPEDWPGVELIMSPDGISALIEAIQRRLTQSCALPPELLRTAATLRKSQAPLSAPPGEWITQRYPCATSH